MHFENHKNEDRMLLKKAVCEGCSDSLAIIYDKYRPIVHDYIKRAGADGMAEDICQSVFMLISEGRCNYDGLADADNYLCVVARNILRNHRKVKTETSYPPKQIEELKAEELDDIQPDPLETTEDYQLLMKLIPELPPKSRQAIELAFMGTGKSRNTIREHNNNPDIFRKRLRYAIKLLREKNNNL